MRVLGIDEAGRGCVFGPLVVAGFLAEDVSDETLREAGAADSKQLTASRRVEVRARLELLGAADVRHIEPHAIDGGNLNRLEEDAIVAIVKGLAPDLVLLDALGHPSTLQRTVDRLRERCGGPDRWICEPRADHTFPTVGAASIFAKTSRDAALDACRERFGALGSGYPSDPATRRWISDWAATRKPWPAFVRTRWQTVADLAQEHLFE